MQKIKKLPIGIQTFEKIAQGNYCYVDKTHFVRKLLDEGTYYFLSRPRRFGKSLFLSTLRAAFEGRKELFQGLFLYDNWDWSQSNPVVHISFGSGVARSVEELQETCDEILYDHSRTFGIEYHKSSSKGRFAELIQTLYEKTGRRVVVLVDEYDKPILDSIENTEMAITLREELKNFYSVIKDADPYIEFVFITGVSKFSKVSLFSGLNNLKDISIDKRFSDICGYTQEELERVFSQRLDKNVNLAEVKNWYNGYSWLGQHVYNPFDILLYLDSKVFQSFWFETGTPAFLIKLLRKGRYFIPELQNMVAGEEIVGSFDVDNITVEALLFQTGYLTITGFEQTGAFRRYQLSYPNLEVRAGLTNAILTGLVQDHLAKTRNQSHVLDALANNAVFDPQKWVLRVVIETFQIKFYFYNRRLSGSDPMQSDPMQQYKTECPPY